MKAIVCTGTRGFQDVRYQNFAEPRVRPRGVVVEVAAAALNFPDVLQPQGLYQDMPPRPFVLGLEFAGTVVETGRDCHRLKVGDRVAGMGQGAFGPYLSAREQMCFALPADIDFATGAALPLSGGTAMLGLTECGRLQADETLIVLGAAGGTGVYAVQIGAALGAHVVGICAGDAKSAAARAAGAGLVIDHALDDVAAGLKDLAEERGIDVVYDPVGGDLFDLCSRRMAVGGRLLSVGFASGRIPKLGANLPLLKSYSLIGVNWSAAAWSRPALSHRIMSDLFDLVAAGKVTAMIEQRIKLEDTPDALRRMAARKTIGKTVVCIKDNP